MKKLLILTSAAFVIAAGVNAQTNVAILKNDIKTTRKLESEIKKEKREDRKELKKLEGTEVSYLAKQQFTLDFGNIPVTTWKREAIFDEATFTKDRKVWRAFYDDQANLVGTTSIRTFGDIPANAQIMIGKKYPGYNIKQVIFFDDNELSETNMVLYNQQFDDEDSYMVELQKNKDKIILQVSMTGGVSFFTRIK